MRDETTEIFDDLYLGLRAGGARRKQRRGERLTPEEQEALSRWQRLSYRLSRHPVVLFVIAPIFEFIVVQRFASPQASR